MTVLCECGHDLGQHPPDPNRPFAWPCRACDCQEYSEKKTLENGMISVFYRKLRMWGQVEHLPEAGVVLVFWDKGGNTRIPVEELEVKA